MQDPLDASWHRLWHGLSAAGDGDAQRLDLLARHAEPWRHYHSQQHLRECIAAFEPVASQAVRPAEVEAALWFHDAVYELQGGDNEARSAALARQVLSAAGVAPAALDRIERLVLATRHDAVPADADERLLVDVDLAILGADEPRFAEYERQIRAEYAFVPQPVFDRKRGEILRAFLDRPALYATAHFRQALEARARMNLRRAIEGIGG